MSYELRIDSSVSGAPQVTALGAATDKLTDSTKRMNDILYGAATATEKMSLKTAQLAIETAKIEQLTIKYRMAQEAAAAAALKRAETEEQANARIGASLKNFISNPLGAAGTAAEKFAVQFGAIGIAAVGVGTGLAVVGGWLLKNAADTAKYAQDISNLASRTGMTTTETQLYSRASEVAGVNAGTLTTAMRTLSRGMSENSDEGKKQKKVLEELGMGADAAFKPMGVLLPEIFEKLAAVGNVMERDRMTIALFGRSGLEMEPLFAQFKELEARVTATGIIMSKDGVDAAKAYQEQLVLLGMKWDALKLTLGSGAMGIVDIFLALHGMSLEGGQTPTYATGQEVLDQKRERDRIALHAGFAAGNSAALDRYDTSSQDPAARTTARLKALGEERASAENKVRGAIDEPGRDSALAGLAKIDAQINAIKAQTKATAELRTEEKQLDSERRSSMERQAHDPIATAILKGRFGMLEHPALSGQFAPLYQQDVQSAASAEQKKAAGIVIAGIEAEQKGEAEVFLRALRQSIKDDEEFIRTGKAATGVYDAALLGRTNIESGTIRDTANRKGRLLAASASPGDELSTLRQQMDLRKQAAEDEFKLKESHKDIYDIDKARLEKVKEIGDADLDYQTKILELKKAQKEETVSMAVGLIMAAQHGGAASYLKSQFEGIESKVLTNLGRAAINSTTGQAITDKLHAGSGTFLGTALAGTPFGPDPMKTAGLSLNTAGTKLSIAADKLMGVALSRSSGGGGLPVGFDPSGDFAGEFSGGGGGGGDYGGEFGAADTVNTGTAGMAATKPLTKGIGIGVAAAAAAYGAYSGFKAGGAQGALTGTSSLAAGAGAIVGLAGVTGPAAPILAGVGLALGMMASLLGDPKQMRAAQIASTLQTSQFMAPVSINASMSNTGGYADMDRFGNTRDSTYSPFPNVSQGFFDYRNNVTVPGRTNSQFGGQNPAPVTVVINAIDANSILDRHQDIADAVARSLQRGSSPTLAETLSSRGA